MKARVVMPRVNLTAKAIDGFKLAQGAQVEYWDAALKGFGVRVSKNGTSERETRTFFVRFRTGKRMRRLTIGDVDGVSLGRPHEGARDPRRR